LFSLRIFDINHVHGELTGNVRLVVAAG
jgi:hypothetical protein